MKFNKLSLACLVVSGSALLTACGGGSDPAPVTPTKVATIDTSAAITPATGAAVVGSVLGKTFDFSKGVTAFGTTTPTTLTLSGTGAAPTFAISAADKTASGVMTYGSCIFTITVSTFPAGDPLALGSKFTVTPCDLKVDTAGKTANGTVSSSFANLLLGTTLSEDETVSVSLSPEGVLTVGGVPVANLTLTAATGGGN